MQRSDKRKLREFLNLPTILTGSRIVIIPLFVIGIKYNQILGAIIFCLASLTDFLDGYIARKQGRITEFGMILDPIADKFLIISALIVLVDMDRLSIWVAIIMITRDFLVTGLRVVALSKEKVMPAEFGGKLKTLFQITAIIFLILWDTGDIDFSDTGTVLIWIAMVLSIISGITYTKGFIQLMKGA